MLQQPADSDERTVRQTGCSLPASWSAAWHGMAKQVADRPVCTPSSQGRSGVLAQAWRHCLALLTWQRPSERSCTGQRGLRDKGPGPCPSWLPLPVGGGGLHLVEHQPGRLCWAVYQADRRLLLPSCAAGGQWCYLCRPA